MSTAKKKIRRKKKKKSSIFDKLTDSSLYTGAHKHRFDKDGKGRGIAGRESTAKGSGSDRGVPWGDRPGNSDGSFSNEAVYPSRIAKKKVVKRSPGSPGSPRRKKKVVRKKKKKGGSIFDKLTDSSQYTGSHKNRFNSDGSGRGAAGRDLGKSGHGSNRGSPW